MEEELVKVLNFLEEIEPLKKTYRTSWDHAGRRETTAEHSYRLALMTACLLPYFPEIDSTEALLMALLHDLAESVTGDVSAATYPNEEEKNQAETTAFLELTKDLPEKQKLLFRQLFFDYLNNATPTAHLIKALDKGETILQHHQGKNPLNFSYEFNLNYGKQYFVGETLSALRKLLDKKTASHLKS